MNNCSAFKFSNFELHFTGTDDEPVSAGAQDGTTLRPPLIALPDAYKYKSIFRIKYSVKEIKHLSFFSQFIHLYTCCSTWRPRVGAGTGARYIRTPHRRRCIRRGAMWVNYISFHICLSKHLDEPWKIWSLYTIADSMIYNSSSRFIGIPASAWRPFGPDLKENPI